MYQVLKGYKYNWQLKLIVNNLAVRKKLFRLTRISAPGILNSHANTYNTCNILFIYTLHNRSIYFDSLLSY